MDKTRGLVGFLALCGLSLFLLSCGSNVSRSSGLLYVLSQGDSNVGSYAINLQSGGLSLINSNASTCASGSSCGFPLDIVLDATGSTAFVLNQGPFNPNPGAGGGTGVPSIYGYKVNSDGSLGTGSDLTSSLNLTANDLAVAMKRDPDDKFFFVITEGNQTISGSCVNHAQQPVQCPQLYVFGTQAGSTSLTLVSQTSLNFVPTALAITTVTPQGTTSAETVLYVTGNEDLSGGNNDNTISEYLVDSAGNVTEQPGSPYATASNPSSVLAVNTAPLGGQGGLFVYVANVTTHSVSVYQVCTVQGATCTQQNVANLTMLPVGSPSNVGANPVAMTVDPAHKFLFVAAKDSSEVFGFRVNGSEGTLTPLSPVSMNTGALPVAVTMHSSGQFLYVSNSGASSISGYTVNTTSGSMSNPFTITGSPGPAGLVAK